MQYQPNQSRNEVKAQRGLTSEGGAEQPVAEVRRAVRVGGLGNLLFAAEAAYPETPAPVVEQVATDSQLAKDLGVPTFSIFGGMAVGAEAPRSNQDVAA